MELEKNKDIARRFVQVWGKGDLDIIDELASSEISVYYPPFPGVIKGIAGFKQQLTRFRSGFGDAELGAWRYHKFWPTLNTQISSIA